MRENTKLGFILIIAGIVLLLSQIGLIPGLSILYLISLAFFAVYAYRGGTKDYGNVGFLIPATIILTVAVYASYDSLNPAFFFVGLGLSFLAVFVIHTFWFRKLDWGERYWPIFPAAGLLLFSVIVGMPGRWLEYMGFINYLWIIALIGLGVWLIYSSFRKK
jgi:hypothetical protein